MTHLTQLQISVWMRSHQHLLRIPSQITELFRAQNHPGRATLSPNAATSETDAPPVDDAKETLTDLIFQMPQEQSCSAPSSHPGSVGQSEPWSSSPDYHSTLERLASVPKSRGGFHWIALGGRPPAQHLAIVSLEAFAPRSASPSLAVRMHAPLGILEKMRQAGATAWKKCAQERVEHLRIHAAQFHEKAPELFSAWLEGFWLSAYRLGSPLATPPLESAPAHPIEEDPTFLLRKVELYFGGQGSSPSPADFWANLDAKTPDALVRSTLATALSVHLTREWSNLPSNIGTPEHYAQDAQAWAQALGLKCTILGSREIQHEKMGLFLGVGQGSATESRVVILEYQPPSPTNPPLGKVALVGKGVTFDSGGISIKAALRMEDMKHDMTGAAVMMGALVLCALRGISTPVVALFGFVENMPDGRAIQPGNVLRARSGHHVEIINTDAEGRLVLADLLDYAQAHYQPEMILDAATLTGAVGIALGKQACAVMGNHVGQLEALQEAGLRQGERIWPLPLFEEYNADLKSDVADLKNSANDGHAGTIRGAVFLKRFIQDQKPWLHLDIASTAYHVSHLPYCPSRGASGLFVRAVADFVTHYQPLPRA